MLKLNKLSSAGKGRKRVGRGGARGGSSGRGFGGQKSRTGAGVGVLFEGGQMPLVRRLPKRGFNNVMFQRDYEIINISTLNDHFDAGATVTYEHLVEHGLVSHKKRSLIKILADGTLNKKLTVYAHKWSAKAQEAIEKSGGELVLIKE